MNSKLFSILLSVLLAVFATACGSDEPRNYDVTGTWYYGTIASTDSYDYTELTLARSGMFSSTRMVMTPAMEKETVTNEMGVWTIDDGYINLYYTGTGTESYYCVSINEDSKTMTLELNGRRVEWYRNAIDLKR